MFAPAFAPSVGRRSGFKSPPIESMTAVGAVGARDARIWIRSARSGSVVVEYGRAGRAFSRSAECTVSSEHADLTASIALDSLLPGTRYGFVARREDDREVLGRGSFETAPQSREDAQNRFAFAVMSCNQPFDAHGAPTRIGAQMLEAALECLAAHDVKFVLTIGDQMYTDYPKKLSLFDERYFRSIAPPGLERIQDCSAAQVRTLLQERYRYFWNMPGWRRLHASYPCYPILDDHDLIDNWGSDPAHATDEWREFGRGARAAYFDYQGSRVSGRSDPGPDFDHEIAYGPIAVYLLDIRSNRRVGEDARIYSKEQELRLLAFLDRHADRDALFVVLSVPAIHLPRWGARVASALTFDGEDFSDRWSTSGHIFDRDRLLTHLHRHQQLHPEQHLALLSGDIHIACTHEIAWRDGAKPLVQLVASGITNRVSLATQAASKLSILANKKVMLESGELVADLRLLEGVARRRQNPYTKLNFGLVELERTASGAYAMRFLVYGQRRGRPVRVYESAWR